MGFPFDFLKKPLLKTRLCDEKMNLQIQNTQKVSPAARYIFSTILNVVFLLTAGDFFRLDF